MTWKFETRATCTDDDRRLELAINRHLGGKGDVSCYTEGDKYGMVYSYRGHIRSYTRDRFEVDPEMAAAALIASVGNAVLGNGWTYELDDADWEPWTE